MGRHMRSLSFFAPRKDVPHLAWPSRSWWPWVLVFLFSGKLRELMDMTQASLTVSTSLVVAGCMVLRRRAPDLPRPVKVPSVSTPALDLPRDVEVHHRVPPSRSRS